MKTIIILLVVFLATGCHNIMYENPRVVSVAQKWDINHKYRYLIEIEAYPANQILFTNHDYHTGDTLTNCN